MFDPAPENGTSPSLSALNVYPIKSCAGIALDVAELGPRGLVHDRSFMLVNRKGKFITQREQPRMALIRPAINSDGTLTVQAPGMQTLLISGDPDGPRYEVTVWKYTGMAVDQGDNLAEWFSTFLGIACRLVMFPDDVVRKVSPKYARHEQDQVGFADGYPFLLISEASLADLNTRLEQPLPMDRFRPNIVVRGTEPYAEDTWRTIRICEVTFDIVKPCARCVITTTDQNTAERGKDPLRTLATYRLATTNASCLGKTLFTRRPASFAWVILSRSSKVLPRLISSSNAKVCQLSMKREDVFPFASTDTANLNHHRHYRAALI